MMASSPRTTRPRSVTLVAAVVGVCLLYAGTAAATFSSSASSSTQFQTRDLQGPSSLAGSPSCPDGTPSASLTWTPGSDWAAAQEVWRSTTSGAAGVKIADKPPTETAHEDTVEAGTTYYYTVKAVKGLWFEQSSEVSVTGPTCL